MATDAVLILVQEAFRAMDELADEAYDAGANPNPGVDPAAERRHLATTAKESMTTCFELRCRAETMAAKSEFEAEMRQARQRRPIPS